MPRALVVIFENVIQIYSTRVAIPLQHPLTFFRHTGLLS